MTPLSGSGDLEGLHQCRYREERLQTPFLIWFWFPGQDSTDTEEHAYMIKLLLEEHRQVSTTLEATQQPCLMYPIIYSQKQNFQAGLPGLQLQQCPKLFYMIEQLLRHYMDRNTAASVQRDPTKQIDIMKRTKKEYAQRYNETNKERVCSKPIVTPEIQVIPKFIQT